MERLSAKQLLRQAHAYLRLRSKFCSGGPGKNGLPSRTRLAWFRQTPEKRIAFAAKRRAQVTASFPE